MPDRGHEETRSRIASTVSSNQPPFRLGPFGTHRMTPGSSPGQFCCTSEAFRIRLRMRQVLTRVGLMSQAWADGSILVTIPALNETGSIGRVVRELRELYPDFDVLVVDDGSIDGTAVAAAEAGATVCQLPFNLGVGGAMRTAYKYALRHGYSVVVQVDADGQHDARALPSLLRELGTADVVIGARFAGAGNFKAPRARRAAMWMLSFVLSRLARARLTDVTSGFRAVGPRAVALFSVHYPAEYLGDTVESLVIALRTGHQVRQVPVQMFPRQAGRPSQSSLRSFAYLVRGVVALGLALIRQWPTPEEISISRIDGASR